MIDTSQIDKAVTILKNGGVIILPTDTVWGIGAELDRPDAIKRLYQLKGREANKPTAVLVAEMLVANRLGIITPQAAKLIEQFWPGGLTLVVKARPGVPAVILGLGETIGLRQPNHPLALALLKKLNIGLVTASANFANQPAPTQKELIDQALIDQVDLVLEGEAEGKSPSTVVDTTISPFKIIREGEIKINKIPNF